MAAGGEVWLGDALRAAGELGVDDAACALLLQQLGLVRAHTAAVPVATPAPKLPLRQPPRPPAPAPAPPAAPGPVASDDPARALGRLPSRLQVLPQPTPRQPDWLSATPALVVESSSPNKTLRAAPLLPRRSRRALLSAALATQVPEGALDVKRIVAQLGRGRPLRRLPRLPRRTLRHGVEVWFDRAPWLRPYLADQVELIEYLQALLPGERVLVREIQARPLPGFVAGSLAPVLLLSDLGALYRPQATRPATPQAWGEWAAALGRRGRHALALVPAAPPRWRAVPGIGQLPWNEHCNLGDVARARSAQLWKIEPAGVDEQAVHTLAQPLSAAVRVSPWLLRETRRRAHLDVATEADLWFSGLLQSQGQAGVVFNPNVAQLLREELQASAGLEQAFALAAQARPDAHDGLALEETLIALELRRTLSEASVELALRPALAGIAAPDGQAVATWAAHAWTRFSPAVRATQAARQLAYAAALRLDSQAWLGSSAQARPALPEGGEWLLTDASGPRVNMSVELRQYADGSTNLVVGPVQAATVACHTVSVPQREPMWLQVGRAGADDTQQADQTVRLDPKAATQIDVGPLVSGASIELRWLAGARFDLRLPQDMGSALDRAVLFCEDAGAHHGPLLLLSQDRGLVLTAAVSADQAQTMQVGRSYTFTSASGEGRVSGQALGWFEGWGSAAQVIQLADQPPGAAVKWAPMDAQLLALHGPAPALDALLFIGLAERAVQAARWLVPSPGAETNAPGDDFVFAEDRPGLPTQTGLLLSPRSGEWWLVFGMASQRTSQGLTIHTLRRQPIAQLAAQLGQARGLGLEQRRAVQRLAQALTQLARARAEVSPRVEGSPVPAPSPAPRSLGTSLRARLADSMEPLKPEELGLFQLDFESGIKLRPAANVPDDEPILVFIHGEAASAQGSFGQLLDQPNAEREQLRAHYRGRLYAFQYRSITQHPAAAAVTLLRAMPSGARVHLVTHSGGGLVGELLCLGQGVASVPVNEAFQNTDEAGGPWNDLLNTLAHDRGTRIERFIRIACPAAGTPIFERSIERGVSLMGLVPGIGWALSLIPGLDRLLSDPQASPGLAALSPQSELITRLNQGITTHAPLTVVAGVAQSGGALSKLGRWAQRFITGLDGAAKGDDLVVPLHSAFGGLERVQGVDYLIAEGPEVSHFNFLRNEATRRAIVAALLQPEGTPAGFKHADSLSELRAQLDPTAVPRAEPA